MTVDKLEEFRTAHNNTGVYATAYRYRQSDQQGELWADYYYNDFDIKELTDPDPYVAEAGWKKIVEDVRHAVSVYEVFYGIPVSQMQFYFSGKKGISLLIPAECLGYKPHEYLNQIFKEMVLEVATYCPNNTLDIKIYDRVRLWRLINSRHEDTGLYKIPLTYQEVVSTGLKEVKELASTTRSVPATTSTPVAKAINRMNQLIKEFKPNRIDESPGRRLKFMPPCIHNLLSFQITEGTRNNSAVALASFFKQYGKPLADTKRILDEWNRTCCVPSLPWSELNTTIESAYRTNKTWGCQTMESLSECEPRKCRFAGRRKRDRRPRM